MGAKLCHPTVDLHGKVCVVTGASSGIGLETAKALYAMGAHVILACRSEDRTTRAMSKIRSEVQAESKGQTKGTMEMMHVDLASLRSTKKFTEEFKTRGLPLHILINNAGIALAKKGYTEDSYETHFQVNHLSPFFLTLELLPILKESAPDSRIVFVSSAAHKNGVLNPSNLQAEHSYGRMKFYNNSKLFNVMTALALQRRLAGTGVTVSSLHPGVVSTEITRSSEDIKVMKLLSKLDSKIQLGRSPRDGAMTTINAAVNPELNKEDGAYYVDCKVSTPSSLARDEEKQEQIWQISCRYLQSYLSPDIVAAFGPAETMSAGRGLQSAKRHRSLPDLLSEDERAKSPSLLAPSCESYIDLSSPSCKSPASMDSSVQIMGVNVVSE